MISLNNSFAILYNRTIKTDKSFLLIKKFFSYNFYCQVANLFFDFDDLSIFIKGYVIPRNNFFNKYKQYNPFELIRELYSQYGNEFVEYIKGNFIILIFESEKIKIFTDHFGLNSCFYSFDQNISAISDSINLLLKENIVLEPDKISLATKTILHRNIPGFTLYKGIFQTTPGSYIELNKKKAIISTYWTPDLLLQDQSVSDEYHSFFYYADLLKTNFYNFITYLTPEAHSITLTGGKDSRTGLAALKTLGINPFGFTYGNKESKDAVYAGKIANRISLKHYVFTPSHTEDYFYEAADEIISLGNPEISIHRSHRLNAFKEMAKITGPNSAYYTGYMAGEFLMGVYYDDLVFTKFITSFWESSNKQSIEPLLKQYFHKSGTVHTDDILMRFSKLRSYSPDLSTQMRQFFGMFEIGVPHHCQDVFLSGQFFKYVYPFFIDIDFLDSLFRGPYSFFYVDTKAKNPFKRYKLYEFNLNIQHILWPEMDDIPFGKKGSYSTREFLKGSFYWSLIKTLRYFFQRKKYPESYVYKSPFINFLRNNLTSLLKDKDNPLHQFYDIPQALSQISNLALPSAESPLHKFSNIVTLYRQMLYCAEN